MTSIGTGLDSLYKARKGAVDIVDVPELDYVMIDGSGAPDSAEFAAAVQALYAVSYGAHFLVKKERGEAPKVMPLEALWWVDDPDQQDMVKAVALGWASMAETDRDRWHWRAMIMQPAPVGEAVARAVEQARAKSLPALDRLRLRRWEEGRCAQTLHLGPYSEEGPSIVRLHEGIAAAGYRPRGHHHELYLGDPRRSAPERLRTVLRQPVEQRQSS
jgi:hypothetical protein